MCQYWPHYHFHCPKCLRRFSNMHFIGGSIEIMLAYSCRETDDYFSHIMYLAIDILYDIGRQK